MLTKICLIGASGRMGREIIQAIASDGSFELAGAVERADSPHIGVSAMELAGAGKLGCVITSDLLEASAASDVIVDFSAAVGTCANLELYKRAGKALVVGSTGFNDAQLKELKALGDVIPFLMATNMSVGVNVMAKLVELAARMTGEEFDIEVFEAHHKHKVDAPSGTAITLAEAAAKGRGIDFSENAVYSREGMTGARKEGTIGFQVLRGGDIAGEHTVYFCGDGERLEITHRASSRQNLAKGALRAAKWLNGKAVGNYTINNVLGL